MSTSSATRAAAFKAAMVAAMRTLVTANDGVLVVYGQPGQQVLNYNDVVSFEDLTSDQSPANLSTNRAREEILALTVVVESFRAGGPEQEQVASDAAYALLALLERHVRVTDTTVGGTVRDCFLTSHRSQGFTAPEDLVQGRVCVVEAIFTAHVRITG